MKAGFIGLGHLGRAMAKRLMAEGVELGIWNRTPQKAEGLGGRLAESPASLISAVDIVFINLFDSDAVQAVLSGPGGLLKADCQGKIVVDTTTNHFDRVTDFHRLMAEAGASYLEAPVLGSVVPAQQGNLTVLISGGKVAYEKALPLIRKIGKTIFFLEEAGLATRMKLINNLVLGCLMASLAEAVAFGEDVGISRARVIDILAAGAGNSGVLSAKKDKLLTDDFSTQFSSSLIYKDLHYLQDLARQLKRPLFTGSVAKEVYGMTFSRGLEGLDFSAVYMLLKEFGGRS